MGLGPSKEQQELNRQEEENARRERWGDERFDALKNVHQRQFDQIRRQLEHRRNVLNNLMNESIVFEKKNEEETRKNHEAHMLRAAEVNARNEADLAAKIHDVEINKKSVENSFKAKTELKNIEHEETMEKLKQERELIIVHKESAIKVCETENQMLLAKEQYAERRHREHLEEINDEHQKLVNNKNIDLRTQLEKHAKKDLYHLENEFAEKTKLIEKNYQEVQINSLQGALHKIMDDYRVLEDKVKKMAELTGDLNEMIGMGLKGNVDDFTADIISLNTDHNLQVGLVENRMGTLKKQMNDCPKITQEFKNSFLEPLEPLQKSCNVTKSVTLKINKSILIEDRNMLESVKTNLESHSKIIADTLQKVGSLDYQRLIQNTLAADQQVSSTLIVTHQYCFFPKRKKQIKKRDAQAEEELIELDEIDPTISNVKQTTQKYLETQRERDAEIQRFCEQIATVRGEDVEQQSGLPEDFYGNIVGDKMREEHKERMATLLESVNIPEPAKLQLSVSHQNVFGKFLQDQAREEKEKWLVREQHRTNLMAINEREREEAQIELDSFVENNRRRDLEARMEIAEMRRNNQKQLDYFETRMELGKQTRKIEMNWGIRIKKLVSTKTGITEAAGHLRGYLVSMDYLPLIKTHIGRLQNVLTKVINFMNKNYEDLVKMFQWSHKQFVMDIANSLNNIANVCTNFNDYLDSPVLENLLEKVYAFELQIIFAYSQIPSVDSLQKKYSSSEPTLLSIRDDSYSYEETHV